MKGSGERICAGIYALPFTREVNPPYAQVFTPFRRVEFAGGESTSSRFLPGFDSPVAAARH